MADDRAQLRTDGGDATDALASGRLPVASAGGLRLRAVAALHQGSEGADGAVVSLNGGEAWCCLHDVAIDGLTPCVCPCQLPGGGLCMPCMKLMHQDVPLTEVSAVTGAPKACCTASKLWQLRDVDVTYAMAPDGVDGVLVSPCSWLQLSWQQFWGTHSTSLGQAARVLCKEYCCLPSASLSEECHTSCRDSGCPAGRDCWWRHCCSVCWRQRASGANPISIRI